MDVLFGTDTCPDHEPEAFGIHEDFPETYVEQLLLRDLGNKDGYGQNRGL